MRSSRLIVILIAAGCLTWAPPALWARSVSVWDRAIAVIFPIRADRPGYPVNCTGWFLAPLSDGRAAVSAYVTAGHCGLPHIVDSFSPLVIEETAWLGAVITPGSDAAIGLRHDYRDTRVFLPLATTPPSGGELALTAGWSGQHLAAARIVFMRILHHGLLEYHSDIALRGGISGAPIVSVRTGAVNGIVVGLRQIGSDIDPHTIIATPASALQTLARLSVPLLGITDPSAEAEPLATP